jgi:hypothetical protein
MDASLVPTSGGRGQSVPKSFFIDTYHLEDTLLWARDAMDLDSKDECEGNSIFP